MIYLIVISWYIIGSIGLIYISREISGRITNKDFIFGLTIGGLGGIITVLIGLYHLLDD